MLSLMVGHPQMSECHVVTGPNQTVWVPALSHMWGRAASSVVSLKTKMALLS